MEDVFLLTYSSWWKILRQHHPRPLPIPQVGQRSLHAKSAKPEADVRGWGGGDLLTWDREGRSRPLRFGCSVVARKGYGG